jgi:hypothetical protein
LLVYGSKSLTDSRGIMRYMKELSRMVKAIKEIAFRNAIVVEIEKNKEIIV